MVLVQQLILLNLQKHEKKIKQLLVKVQHMMLFMDLHHIHSMEFYRNTAPTPFDEGENKGHNAEKAHILLP